MQTLSNPPLLNALTFRADFPIFKTLVNGKPLVYLDNAATTQKPISVIEAISHFYSHECSSVHRGVHSLSARATESYERAREAVCRFINAASSREIVFLRGTTEAINLVAQTYGKANVTASDEILVTAMEHHANIVPWQMLCKETHARLRVVPINNDGELILDQYLGLLGPRTRLVALTYVSNAIGTINPVHDLISMAHARNIPVLVDAAQAIPHLPIDVQALDCDFLAASGHKMYGPTGIGFLYAKERFLQRMPPYQGGGDMISSVSFEKTLFNGLPYKFEAGTPNIAGAIALGAAIEYLLAVGHARILAHEQDLFRYASQKLASIKELRIIASPPKSAAILSFVLDGIHPHDIGTILDSDGVAVRTGHHCAQPLMEFFKVPGTVRASFGLYNTRADVDALVQGLLKAIEVFRP